MRSLHPPAIIAAYLIIAFSAAPALFSQLAPKPSQPKQPAPRQSRPRRPQRADALAEAINELLKLDPLLPGSPDRDSPDTSERNVKPPGDDAPIRELIKYWLENRLAAMSGAQKPSEKVRQRLLEAVEDRPWLAHSLLELLPETPDTSDRLYRLINQEPDDDGWKWKVHEWLSHNSGYFRDDLLAEVRSTVLGETQTAAALKSLSRLDWEAARPFIESYATGNGDILAPTALSLLYEHEMKFGDAAKAEGYRAGLKAMVANRQAPAITRGAALATLMATEWSGRDEWFAALFADPSLSGLREAEGNEPDGKEETKVTTAKLKTQIRIEIDDLYLPPPANLLSTIAPETGELIPVVSSLIGHSSRTVHNAAVRWLANAMEKTGDLKLRLEVARKLLPWLTDPGWVDEGDRESFIRGFASLEMPESVAGLTWILDFDESAENRAAAAGALAQFRDPSVNPALRRALDREEDEERRGDIVMALAECGGFSDDETATAIEAYAKVAPDEDGELDANYDQPDDEKKPLPLKVSIGRTLSMSLTIQSTEGVAVRLIERAKALRATQPKVARKILSVVEGLSLRAAEINLVERIGEGSADVDSIKHAIGIRDSLRKSAFDELNGLIKRGGYAAGVAAAILNDEREWKASLEGRDAKAQLALLACARYLRDKLPVELTGRLLGSPNLALAKAAESYLKVEDSASARKLIFARHPGEAYILGDNSSLDFPNDIGVMKQWEEKLRREVKGQNGPEETYVLGRAYVPKTFTGAVIRVRGGKAEISVYEDPIRWSYRQLTPVELEELKSFTARQEVEDLGPEDVSWDSRNYLSAYRPPLYEYLRLNKDGGRRIVISSMRRAPKSPTLHEELRGLFHKLIDSGEFKVRFALEDKIPGLEVMWADKKQPILSVCQENGELRVLTGDPLAYLFKGLNAPALPEWFKRSLAPAMSGRFKGESEPALPEWRIFTKDGIGAVAPDTPACRRSVSATFSPTSRAVFQSIVGFSTQITISQDDSKSVYAVPQGKNQGVWKAEPGRDPVKLLDDAYQSVLALPDGKWLIGRKVINEGGKIVAQLVRHNLRTNEAFPIVFSREGDHRPLGFSEAHGKVLIVDGDTLSPQANGYLLDIETGVTQAVSGDFRPIANGGTRNLQPAGKPNEFWAAVFDHQKQATIVGRYDAKLFAFTPLIQLPELRFDSSGAWVDQTAGRLWMVYRGCLLRLPLPK